MAMVTYELATPGVIGEKFQEGMIVLNLESGTYFDVGERLVPLLAALEAGISASALQTGVENIEAGAGQQLGAAIDKMRAFGLLREVAAKHAIADHAVCAQIIHAGAAFFVEGHDDLAALIAADPIHDVDPVTGRMVG
jgi:hypothetical protein